MAEPWRPPGSLPADAFASPGTPRLSIVTGTSGCGKTTWCRALIAHVRLSGVELHGVLCPAVFDSGHKTAIDVLFLGGSAHGHRARLAERSRGLTQTRCSHSGESSPLKLAWDFDAKVMRSIDAHFASLKTPVNLLIDEIGPLELIRGAGWQSAVSLLDAGLHRHAYVVVRPGLLRAAVERWDVAEVIDLGASSDRRDTDTKRALQGPDSRGGKRICISW